MSALRFTLPRLRFTPFHRRFTFYEGKGALRFSSFHRRFTPTRFVSYFTPETFHLRFVKRSRFTATRTSRKRCEKTMNERER